MHYTLHLTANCNMRCRYCYVQQNPLVMTTAVARSAIDMAALQKKPCGIVFFGGEPLLCRDLIYETVDYAEHIAATQDTKFYFKITTNGLLLDSDFLRFADTHNIFIALSHDGVKEAHDKNRVLPDGRGTFDLLSPKIDMLLEKRPYSPVLMTIDPSVIKRYADSVAYLYDRGFRYLICSLNYAGPWNEGTMRELRSQYLKLARFYRTHTLREEKFYLSPFEVKLASHIRGGDTCAERCELGRRQISVGPDGRLFPCVQFVGDDALCIGNVANGIDESRRDRLYHINEAERDTCASCSIRKRCNHHCACLNRQVTGSLTEVAPSLCAHERILLPIADSLGEDLYRRKNEMFLQKQYNDMFPLLSLLDDRL